MEQPPEPAPPPAWQASDVPVWALGLLIPATLLATLVVQGSMMILGLGVALWFSEVFVLLALPWLLARFREESPLDALRAHWRGWAPIGWGAALGVANLFGAVIPLQYVARSLSPQEWVDFFDQSRLFERQDPWDMVVLLAAVSIAAPLCEEIFFRGFLQERLTRVVGAPWRVAVFVAVVFSAFHLDPVGFLARFELGLLFGLLYWRMGSVWPGVMAHAANNITSTVMFLLAKGEVAEDEDPPLRVVLLLAAGGLAVFVTLLRFALRTPPRPTPPPEHRPLTASALWPWPAAAALIVGAVLALDLQGVRLNLIDARVDLPSQRQDSDEHEEQLRDELFELRSRARKGQVELDEYENKRREAADLLRLREPASPEEG